MCSLVTCLDNTLYMIVLFMVANFTFFSQITHEYKRTYILLQIVKITLLKGHIFYAWRNYVIPSTPTPMWCSVESGCLRSTTIYSSRYHLCLTFYMIFHFSFHSHNTTKTGPRDVWCFHSTNLRPFLEKKNRILFKCWKMSDAVVLSNAAGVS